MTAATYPWEGKILTRWSPLARAYSRAVFNPLRLGMDSEDLTQELLTTLLVGARAYASENGGLAPPDALATTILLRRRWFYQRARAAKKRDAPTVSYPLESPDDGTPYELPDQVAPRPDAQAEEAERADVLAGLVYALRRSMPPAVFAVLHLRFIEELTPSEIAVATGMGDANARASHQTSARIARAVDAAVHVLGALGVYELADITEMHEGDVDAK